MTTSINRIKQLEQIVEQQKKYIQKQELKLIKIEMDIREQHMQHLVHVQKSNTNIIQELKLNYNNQRIHKKRKKISSPNQRISCYSKDTFIRHKISKKKKLNSHTDDDDQYEHVHMPKYNGDFPFAFRDLCYLHQLGVSSQRIKRIPSIHRCKLNGKWFLSPIGTIIFLLKIANKNCKESYEWMKKNFGNSLPWKDQDEIVEKFEVFNNNRLLVKL